MTSQQPRITGPGSPRAADFPLILLAILAVAYILRLVVSVAADIQIDESRMLFAIDTVAQHGVPLLDSGVLYLIGTPLGYLFAPFAWAFDDGQFLHAARFGNVLLGVLAVWLVWRLAIALTGSQTVASFTAILAAFDPMSLAWGSLALPYQLLAVLALAFIDASLQAVTIRDERRLRRLDFTNPLVWIVIWLFLGSFTSYTIWLFVPGLIVVSWMRWGRDVLAPRHPMRIALEVSLTFPIIVWWLGSWVGPGSESNFNPGAPSFNQIWNNVVRLVDFRFNFDLWRSLYYGSGFSAFVPVLIAVASGMIGARMMMFSSQAPGPASGQSRRNSSPSPATLRLGLALLLCGYWGPVAILADGSQFPLLLPVMPLGYAILVIGLWLVVPAWSITVAPRRVHVAGPVIVAILLLLPALLSVVQGARWQIADDGRDPDYFAATAYAHQRLQQNQVIITPFTTAAAMMLPSSDWGNIVLLAGVEGNSRVGNETRLLESGARVDYWAGGVAISTKGMLCGYLMSAQPPPFILVDEQRLDADWGFRGDAATVIRGGTRVVTQGDFGLEIRQPIPIDQWTTEAKDVCGYKEGTAT